MLVDRNSSTPSSSIRPVRCRRPSAWSARSAGRPGCASLPGYHDVLLERRNPGEAESVNSLRRDAAVSEDALEQRGDFDALVMGAPGVGQVPGKAEITEQLNDILQRARDITRTLAAEPLI